MFVLLQALLPQHAIARVVHRLARVETRWLKNALIRAFVRAFAVDMREAALAEPTAYPTFNAFFTRALAPGARMQSDEPDLLACPVDGTVSEAGPIVRDRLLQAKGQTYSVSALLAGDVGLAGAFADGSFATFYLAPHDYHRIHMPLAGRLSEMTYVPGRLYSVNAATERIVPGLFARNERVICVFETVAGPLALVLVGALIVGSVETIWHGEVRGESRSVRHWRYEEPVRLARGDEVGRFNVGSTVIVLCARGRVSLEQSIRAGTRVRVGQPLGHVVGAQPGR